MSTQETAWQAGESAASVLGPEADPCTAPTSRPDAYWRAANYLSDGQDMPEILNWTWGDPK
jgi:hypothetical protein